MRPKKIRKKINLGPKKKLGPKKICDKKNLGKIKIGTEKKIGTTKNLDPKKHIVVSGLHNTKGHARTQGTRARWARDLANSIFIV